MKLNCEKQKCSTAISNITLSSGSLEDVKADDTRELRFELLEKRKKLERRKVEEQQAKIDLILKKKETELERLFLKKKELQRIADQKQNLLDEKKSM